MYMECADLCLRYGIVRVEHMAEALALFEEVKKNRGRLKGAKLASMAERINKRAVEIRLSSHRY